MSFYDCTINSITSFSTEPITEYPGWVWVDCGCSNGLEWGGEEPRECIDCCGSGRTALHLKSKRLATYPGGKFLGRLENEQGN